MTSKYGELDLVDIICQQLTNLFPQKFAVLSLLVVGQALAAPERLRRQIPSLTGWEIPTVGFEGTGDVIVPFDSTGGGIPTGGFVPFQGSFGVEQRSAYREEEYGVPHEDYGPPHEEYGPPPVPHEEYGPPEIRAEPVTEQ